MPIPLGILAVAGAGAGGGGGAFDLLETTILGSDTASVTFSSLGSYSDYKHLQIRLTARSDDSQPGSSLWVVPNGSYVGTKSFHRLTGSGSSVSSSFGSGTYIQLGDNKAIPAATSTANVFGAMVIDLLDFASTTKNKTFRSLGGFAGGSDNQIDLASGAFLTTDSLTSLLIRAGAGNFVAGSRFSLYGVK